MYNDFPCFGVNFSVEIYIFQAKQFLDLANYGVSMIFWIFLGGGGGRIFNMEIYNTSTFSFSVRGHQTTDPGFIIQQSRQQSLPSRS